MQRGGRRNTETHPQIVKAEAIERKWNQGSRLKITIQDPHRAAPTWKLEQIQRITTGTRLESNRSGFCVNHWATVVSISNWKKLGGIQLKCGRISPDNYPVVHGTDCTEVCVHECADCPKVCVHMSDRRREQKTRKNTTALQGCLYERITSGTRLQSNRSSFHLNHWATVVSISNYILKPPWPSG